MTNSEASGRPGSATVEQLLAAQLAILVADREERVKKSEPQKTELVLHAAGFEVPEIAKLLGKKADTVRKVIQRAQ